MNTEQLNELLIDEIKDIYHAEKQLVKALPKIAKACDSEELAECVKAHLAETQAQVTRLEKVFELLNTPAKGKPCKGMQGLIEEGNEAIEDQDAGPVRDLAIIGAAQRVEHYEISAYGTARAIAEQVGNSQVAKLLLQTENEEKATDEKLSEVAKVIYASEDEEEAEPVLAGNSRSRRSSGRK
ncbi:MAG TPA: ferritin-like domain-containing protein [Bryobacteraceae bacterium]|nr:ferritin-like domain-containing protein [Bryobacteraceae bacterium]